LRRATDFDSQQNGGPAAANGYVPLPPQVQQLARTTLQQVTDPTGTPLLS